MGGGREVFGFNLVLPLVLRRETGTGALERLNGKGSLEVAIEDAIVKAGLSVKSSKSTQTRRAQMAILRDILRRCYAS